MNPRCCDRRCDVRRAKGEGKHYSNSNNNNNPYEIESVATNVQWAKKGWKNLNNCTRKGFLPGKEFLYFHPKKYLFNLHIFVGTVKVREKNERT